MTESRTLPDLMQAMRGFQESRVLLTAIEMNGDDLRERLFKAGLPNLWIPKIIRRVEHIPLLGSGKTDFRGCQCLAIEVTK